MKHTFTFNNLRIQISIERECPSRVYTRRIIFSLEMKIYTYYIGKEKDAARVSAELAPSLKYHATTDFEVVKER